MAARTVTDRNELHIVGLDTLNEGPFCFFRVMLIDDKTAQVLARFVEGGAFGAGPYPGVNPQHPGALDGLLHEQVFQVLAEHGNAVVIGGITLITLSSRITAGERSRLSPSSIAVRW